MLQISNATKNNWKRLNVTQDEIEQKLSKRANKSFSKKNILPKEYFCNPKNCFIVQNFLSSLSEYDFSVEEIVFNLSLNVLKNNGLIKLENNEILSDNKNILKILDEFRIKNINSFIANYSLPYDEEDVIGIIYQFLMKEGSKNKNGSYYTPKYIVDELLKNLSDDCLFLDPCCGTGSFLLNAANKIKNPKNIYGIDLDEIACFISKINLIVKYKDFDFYPNIYNFDFLKPNVYKNIPKQFDFICTNPPWGAKNIKNNSYIIENIKSKESFSLFIVQARNFLSDNGKCAFVLPEAILNVKTHSDIRKYILNNFSIEEIRNWGRVFSGVLSNVISIKLANSDIEEIKYINKTEEKIISKSFYLKNKNYNFCFTDKKDIEFLEKIYSVPYKTLENSLWGLGIVTGNNSKHIIDKKTNNAEVIYTGKDVSPYFLKQSNKYIVFDRNSFQQTAPDEIYRADEKLVYKFISNKLVFSYDNKKSLILNSANILIPAVETHSVKTVLAFLNSKLFQNIYKIKFGEIKILKGNLMQLPFPIIKEEIRKNIENLVDEYLKTKDKKILDKIDTIIFKIFNI